MSMEQLKQQHPLDKRLQAVMDEYKRFPSEVLSQEQIFKEILGLRVALLCSYDESDYKTNLQALEAETAQLYSEIDAPQSWVTSFLGSISSPDPVQLDRQAKISDLRVAIEEDKKTVQKFLDSPPETRMAYLIGVASHFSLEDRDELMELTATIHSLYESVPEKERGVKSLYILDGEILEASVEEIYQQFLSRMQPLLSPTVEVQEQSDATSEVSQGDSLGSYHEENYPELGDEERARLNELGGYAYRNELFNEQEARIHAKPLPPTPSRKPKDKPLSAREQMLKKLDEKLDEIDIKMRAIGTKMTRATEQKDIDEHMAFYFEATLENDLYRNIKDYANASVEDRVKIKTEIDRLLDDLNRHYSKNTEIYTGVLEAAGMDAPIDSQIEAEIAKIRQNIDPYLNLEPLVEVTRAEQNTAALVPKNLADSNDLNASLSSTSTTSTLMERVKAAPIPPAPIQEKADTKTSVQDKVSLDEDRNIIIEAQKKQADNIINVFKKTKSELLNDIPEKLSTEEAQRIQESVKPLLQFIHDNRDDDDLRNQVKEMRAEVADMQAKLKQYLKTSATPERLIKRAPSAITKVFSDKLFSRHIIENTKNEIKAVNNEVPRFYHMNKKR